MLKLIDVHTYYGESHILAGISIEVGEDSVVALLGRNGMGKTTTAHSIIGFTPPRYGEILFKGEKISGLPPYQISRKGLALVPQGRRIFPSLSVEENLTIGARTTQRGNNWSLEMVYPLFPILKKRASSKGTMLSGGEQQMLCIARALLTNSELLIMDEPSEGLSPIIVKEIGNIITQLKNNGLSILLIEQNLPIALKVADYVYILDNGKIAYQSATEELEHNAEVQNKYLAVDRQCD